ncbi:uncharacterized protein LOC123313937 [Coccinella septempunctata]|uniref:uncharacterized protein LOC123313937 n=1 Tax=Coccinella septempunctata TaxID=41139 RepID=UPI001D0942C4|nr:uncharacterized protein LOC123313937 [Coccinella septempunctata]
MRERCLEVAAHKTELLVVRGARNVEDFRLNKMGEEVKPSKELKYLGVIFQRNLSFSKHIEHSVQRASEKLAAISRLMPNISGPSYAKRRVLCGVTHSILLYAVPVWRETLKQKKQLDQMTSLQRRSLFRTVSA